LLILVRTSVGSFRAKRPAALKKYIKAFTIESCIFFLAIVLLEQRAWWWPLLSFRHWIFPLLHTGQVIKNISLLMS
jgi:hypothetical protein